MIRTIALIALSAIPAAATVDLTLKGVWKATVDQAWYCGEPAPVAMEQFSFEILDAPMLTVGVQSFDYNAANVVAAVTIRVREQGSHPRAVISGLLVGELVKDTHIGSGPTAKAVGLALKGYIVSREDYGAWKQSKKKIARPRGAGEVEFEVSGSFLHYTLSGIVRSNEGCSDENWSSAPTRELTGHFGRNIPSKWSAHVTLVQK